MTEIATVAQLHDSTTMFHAFIYFAPEAGEEYEAVGVTGRSGYFASRSAALGAIDPEVTIATFYNFSPDLVVPAMSGVWDVASPDRMQAARWRAAKRVLDAHVKPAVNAGDVAEALAIADAAVAGLSWAGRPLAAGNAAVLRALDDEFGGDDLLRLWQLVTVLREWRGDAHIGLLIAEPLDGAECTVVSEGLAGLRAGVIRATRAWNDEDWAGATARLQERGWVADDGSITDKGREDRLRIEDRTNELSAALWSGVGDAAGHRLADLLKPANKALLEANYFAAIGRPAKK